MFLELCTFEPSKHAKEKCVARHMLAVRIVAILLGSQRDTRSGPADSDPMEPRTTAKVSSNGTWIS